MRFAPSRQSYGFYGEEPAVEEPAVAEGEEEKKGGGWQQYLPAVRSLLFGEGAREEAAIVAQQIENLRRKVRAGAGLLHNVYIDEIEKKKARLVELQAMAEEEKSAAEKEKVTRTAIAVMGILGAVLVAGMVFNQVQRARLLQAQIRKEG